MEKKMDKKKEVGVVLLDIHKTTTWDVLVLNILTGEYEEIFIPFFYQGSLMDVEAKYNFHQKVFDDVFESFSQEIAKKILNFKEEKKKKAAWMDSRQLLFSSSFHLVYKKKVYLQTFLI